MTLPWFPRPTEFLAWLCALADAERDQPKPLTKPREQRPKPRGGSR